jgi:lipopolysaccharide transport system ATP-binding protein
VLEAVVFDRVWKRFRRGERHDSLRDFLPSLARRLFRQRNASQGLGGGDDFWALKDVSFSVKPGEALGIIGPNGAGKSTTLKLLTRILKPTRGVSQVRGRVGALIEVAAGFHPDLTGRENIFLQGAIMGMKRVEIGRRLEEIVEFAGVGDFVDTPVKRYSSGMSARLGFSIAAHLSPDVLFIDEVLSVGDIAFQTRCLERLREHLNAGVTLVFVSHNLQAVAMLCERTLVIGKGECLFDGATSQALDVYVRASTLSQLSGIIRSPFRLHDVCFFTADGAQPADRLAPHTPCRLEAIFECLKDAPASCVGIQIERTSDLLYCYGATTQDLDQALVKCRAGQFLKVSLAFTAHFTRGHYRINLNVYDPVRGFVLSRFDNVAHFAVSEMVSYSGVVDVEMVARVVGEAADSVQQDVHPYGYQS